MAAPRYYTADVVRDLTDESRHWPRYEVVHGELLVTLDTLVQPDIFVVPPAQARALDWSAVCHLLLAIEIVSPSSVRADRFTKRRLYQEQGVPVYWVIDADAHEAEVWTPGDLFPRTATGRLDWHPAGAAEPFTLELAELFRPI